MDQQQQQDAQKILQDTVQALRAQYHMEVANRHPAEQLSSEDEIRMSSFLNTVFVPSNVLQLPELLEALKKHQQALETQTVEPCLAKALDYLEEVSRRLKFLRAVASSEQSILGFIDGMRNITPDLPRPPFEWLERKLDHIDLILDRERTALIKLIYGQAKRSE